jgi:alcohol dehydrogenase class IV
MENWQVIQNRRVIFGAGTLRQTPALLAEHRDKPVMLIAFSDTADFVVQTADALRREGMRVVMDASLRGEPSCEDIDRIAALARQSGAGSVLAIGGGSVLDAAKACAMLAVNPGSTEAYQMHGKTIENTPLPLYAVPTTAGTGSEATRVSVVYNAPLKLKKSFYGDAMIAGTVILDPEVTCALPKPVTISTGADALSHAVESLVSKNATAYTRMYSLESIRHNLAGLRACLKDGSDLQARGHMLLASYFGGVAIGAGIGLAHIIAQPLGGLLHIPHGVACAVYLPHAMAFNLPCCTEAYSQVARLFGAQGCDSPELAQKGVQLVADYLKEIGAPDNIRAYLPKDGLDLDDTVACVAAATGHIKVNPRQVTPEAIRETIEKTL